MHRPRLPPPANKIAGIRRKQVPGPKATSNDKLSSDNRRNPRTLTKRELDDLRECMKNQLNGREPREFQVDMVQAQEERRDAVCHAATGLGKTFIAAAPHALPKNMGKVTILVSPLIALQTEMVETMKSEFNVTAVAINSAYGGLSLQIVEDIVLGKYQVVLISPEMLLSQRFINEVLDNNLFSKRVYSVFVDEAHCISHWGASFRKAYAAIGMVRSFLPPKTPVIAVSATLTARVIDDISAKLQISDGAVIRNMGNDRLNISIVVRAIQNQIGTFSDIDFVIGDNVKCTSDILKTWIYVDSITMGDDMVDYIRNLLPPHLQHVVRSFNAVMTHEYRAAAMDAMRRGEIRILVCTDTAGMGCNIPDIDVVVQWRLPSKMSLFVQRAGRAARDATRTGLAVLLVEPTAYSASLSGCEERPTGIKPKSTAIEHGRQRGGRDCRDLFPDHVGTTEPQLTDRQLANAEDEGLHAFVFAHTCRRQVWAKIFGNPDPCPSVACCDVCNPSLLNRTRPGEKPVSPKSTRLTRTGVVNNNIVQSLLKWRASIHARLHTDTILTPSTILPNAAISTLATARNLDAKRIEGYLKPQWQLWQEHGEELVKTVLSVEPDSVDEIVDTLETRCKRTPEISPSKRQRLNSGTTTVTDHDTPSTYERAPPVQTTYERRTARPMPVATVPTISVSTSAGLGAALPATTCPSSTNEHLPAIHQPAAPPQIPYGQFPFVYAPHYPYPTYLTYSHQAPMHPAVPNGYAVPAQTMQYVPYWNNVYANSQRPIYYNTPTTSATNTHTTSDPQHPHNHPPAPNPPDR